MIYSYVLLYFLITVLPGIYCAVNKNFIYTLNPKYNYFILRFFFAVPGLSIYVFLFSFPFFIFFPFDIFEVALYSSEMPSDIYVTLLIPLFVSLLGIFLLHRYVIPTESPEILQRKNLDHELFIYFQNTNKIFDGKSNGTKFEPIRKREKGKAPIGKQLTELIIMYEEIKRKNIGFTEAGEIVLTQKGLDIFNAHQINGFSTRPAKLNLLKMSKKRSDLTFPKEKDFTYIDENGQRYYQIITSSVLPPLLPQTKIKTKDGLMVWESFVTDSKLYYNRQILENIQDINHTDEYFGSNDGFSFPIQKFWIITKKVKDILIQDFDLHELDFIPVHLVDDE